VRRLIADTVEDAVTESFLRGSIKEGDTVLIDCVDGKVTVGVVEA
jgi:ATP-dependent Clp protease ATP-binding subunit ClpA